MSLCYTTSGLSVLRFVSRRNKAQRVASAMRALMKFAGWDSHFGGFADFLVSKIQSHRSANKVYV